MSFYLGLCCVFSIVSFFVTESSGFIVLAGITALSAMLYDDW